MAVTIDVSTIDKIRFKDFMKQELAYYNSLIEGLGPRTRTFPETILGIHKEWENLFGQLAYEGKSIEPYARSKEDSVLPQSLEPHRKMILGRDSRGKRFLDDRMFNIMQIATVTATIHPTVRRNMALQILKYCKEQASNLIKRNDTTVNDQDLYKKPSELLTKQEITTKRHLQLPRSTLYSVIYDPVEERTSIQHCYSENPLIIQGYDLEHNNHWNFLIIHQITETEVISDDPWIVDIMSTEQPYLIKYTDVQNTTTGKIFAQAKRRDF